MRVTWIMLTLLLATAAPSVIAQAYPVKSVRLVVPFPPGAGLDVVGRTIAQKLTESWGHSMVVDNRAGAGGTIGADIVAKSPPDGYTLLMAGIASLGTAKGLYARLPYDPVNDFAPVMLIARAPSALFVNAALPIKSVGELIAYARANPGKLNYSSGGSGSTGHLSVEIFKRMAGLDIVHVPHKGPTQALTALATGEAQVGLQTPLSALSVIQSGRIRMLATTGTKRLTEFPDTPTVAEAGVAGYEFYVWYGVLAPAGTAAAIVLQLNRDIGKVVGLPEVKNMLLSQGSEIVTSSPAEFRNFIVREVANWTRVIREVGVRID